MSPGANVIPNAGFADECDAAHWAADDRAQPELSGRTYAALGHTFSLECSDAQLACHLRRLLAGLEVPCQADHVYTIDKAEGSDGPFEMYRDGHIVDSFGSANKVVDHLVSAVNLEAIASTEKTHLVLHAAACTNGQVTVVLPAPSGSGKTTTVAGLVLAGMGYLTDEAVAVDPSTMQVIAYPKPLSVKPGSQGLLSGLAPTDPAFERGDWHVAPGDLRVDPVGVPGRPSLLVRPQFVDGATSLLTPVSRGRMTYLVANNTFRFRYDHRRLLPLAAKLCESAACFELTVGDLASATQLVLEAVRDTERGALAQ